MPSSTVHQVIRLLQKSAWQTSEDKGWHELDVRPAERIALMHSELSEALEELRKGKRPDEIYYPYVPSRTTTRDDGDEVTVSGYVEDLNGKPEGFPVELADVFIRILDTCEIYGIDLGAVTLQKMIYNRTRPRHHGGKKL